MFHVPYPESDEIEIIDEPSPTGYARQGRIADEIDYELFGTEMQFVEITLDPGEQVIAEAGAMMHMDAAIQMETVFGNPSSGQQGFWSKIASAGKRVLTGESIFNLAWSRQRRQKQSLAAE